MTREGGSVIIINKIKRSFYMSGENEMEDVLQKTMKEFPASVAKESWIKFYRPKILDFLVWCEKEAIVLSKMGAAHIDKYLEGFPKNSKRQLNYFLALNSFFSFSYRHGYIKDVMTGVVKPMPPQKPPQYILEEHLQAVASYIDDEAQTLEERLLLAFALYTGLDRRYLFELKKLQIRRDGDGQPFYFYVLEQGYEHLIPLHRVLQKLFKAYFQVEGFTPLNQKVFDYSETYLSDKLSFLTKKITGKAYSPQKFGNTFIQRAYLAGVDVHTISEVTLKSFSAIERHIPRGRKKSIEERQSIIDQISFY